MLSHHKMFDVGRRTFFIAQGLSSGIFILVTVVQMRWCRGL